MVVEDAILVCRLCRCDFVFSGDQQAFFKDHDLLPPAYCKSCRMWKKSPAGARPPAPPGVTPRILRCGRCNESFAVDVLIERSIVQRGAPLPTWCPACRERTAAANRKAKEAARAGS
jgi:hypothetical protein